LIFDFDVSVRDEHLFPTLEKLPAEEVDVSL
jgi:hypothetical protein